jgi:hypothetical protein
MDNFVSDIIKSNPELSAEIPKFYDNHKVIYFNKDLFDINNIFNNKKVLNDLFEKITLDNMEDVKYTYLKERKFNNKTGEIEDVNDNEFNFIYDFIINNKDFDLNRNVSESNTGNIIMYGYFRFLEKENYIDFNLNDLLEKYDIGEKLIIKEDLVYVELEIFDNNPKTLYNRFLYYCNFNCYLGDTDLISIPIYLDKNKDLFIPTYRTIGKEYFTMLNISKKLTFMDIDIKLKKFTIFLGERFNLLKYDIKNNKIKYSNFPSYFNEESFNEIKILEEKHKK